MTHPDHARATGRVLALTQFAPFQILPAHELELIARTGREQMLSRRTVLVRAGERPDALHVPLHGALELSMPGHREDPDWNPPRLSALALLAQTPLLADLVAPAGTVMLTVDQDALAAVLEEHGQLCRHLLGALAVQLQRRRPMSGPSFRVVPEPEPPSPDVVWRMLTFRKLLGPGGSGMSAVVRLARVAREVHLATGMTVTSSPDEQRILTVTHGALRLLPDEGGSRLARAGEVVGLFEAVAAVPISFRAIATVPSHLLVLARPELEQAIEDEDSLCLDLIRGFAADLFREGTGGPSGRDQPSPRDRTPECFPPVTSARGPTRRRSS